MGFLSGKLFDRVLVILFTSFEYRGVSRVHCSCEHVCNVLIASLTSFFRQTDVLSAKYIMKTDDDAFVRVDEVVASLKRVNVTRGLLHGLIESDSQPHRNTDSKWYISPELLPSAHETAFRGYGIEEFNLRSSSLRSMLSSKGKLIFVRHKSYKLCTG